MEEDDSQITEIFRYWLRLPPPRSTKFIQVYSVLARSSFPFYFRFFRYKKYPRANRFENQISVISAISAGPKLSLSAGLKTLSAGNNKFL